MYGDLYATGMWAIIEDPENSGNFTTNQIPFNCASDSPIKCDSVPGSSKSKSSIGYIYSFGEDNKKDVYVLTSDGVYRIVRPSRCGYTCSKETATPAGSSPAPSPSASQGSILSANLFLQLSYFLLCLACCHLLNIM